MPEYCNMTLRQAALLGIVADADVALSYDDMALMLGATKPVVTRAFDSLSDLGLMVRSSDPTDRRKRIPRLTALGIEARERMRTTVIQE